MNALTKLAILFTILLSFGCKKSDPTPVAPIITFLDANLSPDKSYSIVNFEFFDGDGDLGLKQDENTGAYQYNVFVDYYEKINGTWMLKSPVITWNTTDNKFDTTSLNLRMPFIENLAKKKLEGKTAVNLFFNFNADTFRYEIYIKDRTLHKSNKITTSDLVVF